jgi:hypothetical protein
MDTENTHEISLQTAIDMTTLYRANRPTNFPICETFEIDTIEKLLAVPGCKFLRIYYGMKENMEMDAILVAADEAGDDILPPSESTEVNTDDVIIIEDGFRCPPACPSSSPLNSD